MAIEDSELESLRSRLAKAEELLDELSQDLEGTRQSNRELSTKVQTLQTQRDQSPITGVQITRVAGSPDEIGSPVAADYDGRVPVVMKWDSSGDDPPIIKAWLAMDWLTASGGGQQFTPRAGQHVYVAFIDGNPEKPVIIGYWPNKNNPMPYKPYHLPDGEKPYKKGTALESSTLAATKSFDSKFPDSTTTSDYNPSTYNLSKSVIRSANYGTTSTKASEIAFVDQAGSEALTVATQGEYREYAKGNHYFRTEGTSDQMVGGNLNLYVVGETNILATGDLNLRYKGDLDVEYTGTSHSKYLEKSAEFHYGGVLDVFLGAHDDIFLVQRTECTIGLYVDIVIGMHLDLDIAGRLALRMVKSKEWVFGTSETNVNGTEVRTINGREYKYIMGYSSKSILGTEKVYVAVRDENEDVHLHEVDTHTGAYAVQVVSSNTRTTQTDEENKLSGLLTLDSGGDEDEAVISPPKKDEDESGLSDLEQESKKGKNLFDDSSSESNEFDDFEDEDDNDLEKKDQDEDETDKEKEKPKEKPKEKDPDEDPDKEKEKPKEKDPNEDEKDKEKEKPKEKNQDEKEKPKEKDPDEDDHDGQDQEIKKENDKD